MPEYHNMRIRTFNRAHSYRGDVVKRIKAMFQSLTSEDFINLNQDAVIRKLVKSYEDKREANYYGKWVDLKANFVMTLSHLESCIKLTDEMEIDREFINNNNSNDDEPCKLLRKLAVDKKFTIDLNMNALMDEDGDNTMEEENNSGREEYVATSHQQEEEENERIV